MKALLMPLLACACPRGTAPEIPTQAPAEPAPAAQRGLPEPSAWSSPACENRSWERLIRFEGERFQAQDMIAPCPPGKVCVWSGILLRTGSWSLDRRQLRLTLDADPAQGQVPGAGDHRFPEQLWLADDGRLTEDEGRCPYAQVPL